MQIRVVTDQPWEVAWTQAQAARTRMLDTWYELREPTDEAAWWIRKSGSEHYAEHTDRLREWAAELIARRPGDATARSPRKPDHPEVSAE